MVAWTGHREVFTSSLKRENEGLILAQDCELFVWGLMP